MNSWLEKLDLAKLRHFYLIAYFQGFSKASRASGLSQPALSSALKKLELKLGTQLAERSSTEFKLTPAGAALFEYCQSVESSWSELLGLLRKQELPAVQRLRLATALSVGYGPVATLIRSLQDSAWPMDIDIQSAISSQVVRALQEAVVDLAFLPDDVHEQGLHTEIVLRDELVLVSGDRGLRKIGTDWRKSLSTRVLISSPPDTPMRSMIDRVLLKERLSFRSQVSATGVEAIHFLVRRGLGCGFLLRSSVEEELRSGDLHEIRLPVTLPKRAILLAHRTNDRGTSQLVKRFLKRLPSGRSTSHDGRGL